MDFTKAQTVCSYPDKPCIQSSERIYYVFPDYIQAFTGCSEVNYGALWKLEDIL